MKNLLKYLAPFAPDQSGAASVFFELGGIIVVCDAGGCTGNICGFDEPRWFHKKSAIFSAGLRDMDAILGRDKRLIEKLGLITQKQKAEFAVILGTPVPAVIATDFKAMKRMAAKSLGLPVMTVECTGTHLYDEGQQMAYLELFKTFAEKDIRKSEGRILGVLGMTPMDLTSKNQAFRIREYYNRKGYETIWFYGCAPGLDPVKKAGSAAKNIVLCPGALKAAQYLKETFGTPYEMAFPVLDVSLEERLLNHPTRAEKILILHQQMEANEIRKRLRAQYPDAYIQAATFFLQSKEAKEEGDLHLETEEDLQLLAENGGFDLIVADPLYMRALPFYQGDFIPAPHFAVSGLIPL